MVLFRVEFISHAGTLQVVNTLHVLANGDPWTHGGDPTPTQVADEINTKMQALYLNMLTPAYTFDRIHVVQVPNPNDPSQVPTAGEHNENLAGARTVGDSDLPPRIGGLLTFRTGLVGRGFRGRMFCPPLEKKAAIVADLIAPADDYTVAMNAFGAKVVDANLASGSTWSTLWTDTWHGKFVTYSPTRHKQGNTPFTADITSYTNTRRLAYLSSRDK